MVGFDFTFLLEHRRRFRDRCGEVGDEPMTHLGPFWILAGFGIGISQGEGEG